MTITVQKVSVKKVQDGMFSIILNLKVLDGAAELINQDFSENHRIGKTVGYTLGRFQEKMQEFISDYIAEKNIYNSAQLNTAIVTLTNSLQYI